jgi:uncharacterized protein DUF6886
MRLFHFSDDPNIEIFIPRPVKVPSARPAGREWLNGPLVWAIDEQHQPMYLFPRDCPRILAWPTPKTSPADYEQWWKSRSCRMIAHIELAWFDRFRNGILYRYELPETSFESLNDAGMWIAKTSVIPSKVETLHDLATELSQQNVDLQVVETLLPFKDLWKTTLHVSGIRLRNAQDWQ